MARPRTITDEQIVDAAREVFLEHGFSATTAEIARRAGISEGTLFKRFSSKEELFAETVGLNDYQHWHHEITALIGQGEIRANLERLSHLFLAAARRLLPHLMLMWSRGHAPPVKMLEWRDPVAEDIRALSAYFGAEIELGRLRPFDAEVMATALMGALSTHAHRELISGPSIDPERYVQSLLNVLWPGLEPPGARPDPDSASGALIQK